MKSILAILFLLGSFNVFAIDCSVADLDDPGYEEECLQGDSLGLAIDGLTKDNGEIESEEGPFVQLEID